MKLYEDVPLDTCVEINRLSSSLDSDECQKSIIEGDLIPRTWNVIILDISLDNKKKEKKECGGIYTTLNILEQAFPNENPLTAPICDGKHKSVYVLYFSYIEEIKKVLPIACSVNGASLRDSITPEMNFFLYYINASQEILNNFVTVIRGAVAFKGINFFLELSRLNQYFLEKNITPANYRNILMMYWLCFTDIRISFYYDNQYFDDEYIDALVNGGELTYRLLSLVYQKIKEKTYTCTTKKHSDVNHRHLKKYMKVILEEYEDTEGKYSRMSIDYFLYVLNKAIRDPNYHAFLKNILE
jgi:hypothetical protein